MKKPKILIVGGPTASGKSTLGVMLAKDFGGCVIGADSMQIYKKMDIGTGKITPDQTQGIAHKMIDIIPADSNYSVGVYVNDSIKEIDKALSKGLLPIIVGGTGMYINALINSHSFSQTDKNQEYREHLIKQAEKFGNEYLHQQLTMVDSEAAQKISPSDQKRIIRALEIFNSTGKTKSSNIDAKESKYNYLMFVLACDRQKLYNRIENRVDEMLDMGLIEEVKSLSLDPTCQSMQAIGYKETAEYIMGKISKTQLADLIKMNTRRYAKRQITYFKNIFPKANVVSFDDYKTIEKTTKDFLKG